MVNSDESNGETTGAVGGYRDPREGSSRRDSGQGGNGRGGGGTNGGGGRSGRLAAGSDRGREETSETQPDIATRVKRITRDLDYVSQMTSIVTELGLTDVQAKAYFSTLDHKSLEREKPFLEFISILYKYQGFSPRDMIQMLLNLWEQKHAEQGGRPEATFEYTVSINNEDKIHAFTSDERFMKDMEFICINVHNKRHSICQNICKKHRRNG